MADWPSFEVKHYRFREYGMSSNGWTGIHLKSRFSKNHALVLKPGDHNVCNFHVFFPLQKAFNAKICKMVVTLWVKFDTIRPASFTLDTVMFRESLSQAHHL